MRVYAEQPGRIARQVLADLLVIGWVVAVVLIARWTSALVDSLAGPSQSLADSGERVSSTFEGAARAAGAVPFVGGELARALGQGSEAGTSMAAAGRDEVVAIHQAAVVTGIGIVVLAAVPIVIAWLIVRARYAREATATVAVRAAGPDLLALRALTRHPARELLRVCPDPARAWRDEDPVALRALATLELRTLGLRAPREAAPVPAPAAPPAAAMPAARGTSAPAMPSAPGTTTAPGLPSDHRATAVPAMPPGPGTTPAPAPMSAPAPGPEARTTPEPTTLPEIEIRPVSREPGLDAREPGPANS